MKPAFRPARFFRGVGFIEYAPRMFMSACPCGCGLVMKSLYVRDDDASETGMVNAIDGMAGEYGDTSGIVAIFHEMMEECEGCEFD